MKCVFCGDPLPSGKKASARYCNDSCRAGGARRREQVRAKKLQQLASRPQSKAGGLVRAQRPTPRTVKRTSRNLVQAASQTLSADKAVAQLRVAPTRIDMKEQVLRLAPQNATGYRLVLPATQDGALPKLAPRRQNGEPRPCYQLAPFEYPLDVRLRDGKWYRILWVEKEGRAVHPSPEQGVPSLYFFLGTPDRGELPHSQQWQPPALLVDSGADNDQPKLLTAPATEALATSEPVPTPPDQAEQPAATDCAQAKESQKDQPTLKSTEPEPTPKVKTEPLHSFWTQEGKYALQLESLAQLLYEQRLAAAKAEGGPLPTEPLTQLSRDERKNIRKFASHPALLKLGRFLNLRFEAAKQAGSGAFESLPLNPATLSESDQRLLQSVPRDPEKKRFVTYLHQRGNALLVGDPLPVAPQTEVPAAERKRLTKVLSDLRSITSMVKTSDPERRG